MQTAQKEENSLIFPNQQGRLKELKLVCILILVVTKKIEALQLLFKAMSIPRFDIFSRCSTKSKACRSQAQKAKEKQNQFVFLQGKYEKVNPSCKMLCSFAWNSDNTNSVCKSIYQQSLCTIPVTWYGINHTGTQMTQWDFQIIGKSGQIGKEFFRFGSPTALFASQHNLFCTM